MVKEKTPKSTKTQNWRNFKCVCPPPLYIALCFLYNPLIERLRLQLMVWSSFFISFLRFYKVVETSAEAETTGEHIAIVVIIHSKKRIY